LRNYETFRASVPAYPPAMINDLQPKNLEPADRPIVLS
jgi:hypothetical protein